MFDDGYVGGEYEDAECGWEEDVDFHSRFLALWTVSFLLGLQCRELSLIDGVVF